MREAAAPQDQPVGPSRTPRQQRAQGQPSDDGGRALAEPEAGQANRERVGVRTGAGGHEHVVEVAREVGDVGRSLLARHPGGPDAAVARRRGVDGCDVEPAQRLGHHHQPPRLRDGAEVPPEVGRQLAVAVTGHPDLIDGPVLGPQHGVPGGLDGGDLADGHE